MIKNKRELTQLTGQEDNSVVVNSQKELKLVSRAAKVEQLTKFTITQLNYENVKRKLI